MGALNWIPVVAITAVGDGGLVAKLRLMITHTHTHTHTHTPQEDRKRFPKHCSRLADLRWWWCYLCLSSRRQQENEDTENGCGECLPIPSDKQGRQQLLEAVQSSRPQVKSWANRTDNPQSNIRPACFLSYTLARELTHSQGWELLLAASD